MLIWGAWGRQVPKALLPKGNGRDIYPWVQVNGRDVCVACVLCAVCVRWSSLLCLFVAAAGPVRPGGSCACPGCGALVALPSRHPPPPFRPPRRRTLGRTGCTAHCAVLRAGAAVLLLVLLWRCYWAREPTPAPVPIEGLWGCCTLEQFSSVVWHGVVWCGVVWCGVVWCAEGAVTRRQWPGCLPMGTSKREGCVYSARAVCRCVVNGGKRGSWGHLDDTHQANVVIPVVPTVLPPSPLAGAGVAPAIPTSSCCLGPGGLSATWLAPWRGCTRP